MDHNNTQQEQARFIEPHGICIISRTKQLDTSHSNKLIPTKCCTQQKTATKRATTQHWIARHKKTQSQHSTTITAVHRTAQHSKTQHATPQHSTAQHSTTQRDAARDSAVQQSFSQCNPAQLSLAQPSVREEPIRVEQSESE